MYDKMKYILRNLLFAAPFTLLVSAMVFADTLDPTENFSPAGASKRAITYQITREYSSASNASSVNFATQTTPIYVGDYKTAIIQIYGGIIDETSPTVQMTGAMGSADGTGAYGSTSQPTWWIEGKPGFSSTATRYSTMPIKIPAAFALTSTSSVTMPYSVSPLVNGTTDVVRAWGIYEVDIRGINYMRFNIVNNASDHVVVIGLDKN